jgi:hypothetical protein
MVVFLRRLKAPPRGQGVGMASQVGYNYDLAPMVSIVTDATSIVEQLTRNR